MKQYEKPKLLAFSLSGNERLCGCGLALETTDEKPLADEWGVPKGANGEYDNGDFSSYFALAENDCSQKVDVDAYCKYTVTTDVLGVVVWS